MKRTLLIAACAAVLAVSGCEQGTDTNDQPAPETRTAPAGTQADKGAKDTAVNTTAGTKPLVYELHVSGMT